MPERKLMTGNEAIARGAWEEGVHVATSYPGTPVGEIPRRPKKAKTRKED